MTFLHRTFARSLVLLAMVLPACSQTARPQTQDSLELKRVEAFLDEVSRSDHVQNLSRTLWLLEQFPERGIGFAWLGEIREDGFWVAEVTCTFNPCALTFVGEAVYPVLQEESRRAMINAFTFESHHEDDLGGVSHPYRQMAGFGRAMARTICIGGVVDISQIGDALKSEKSSLDLVQDRVFPIESAIPWMIARYYSPFREMRSDW